MRRRRRRGGRVCLAAALLSIVGACQGERAWREQPQPYSAETVQGREEVRVTLRDGEVVELEQGRVVISPLGSYVGGRISDRNRRRIPVEDVVRLETRAPATKRLSEMGTFELVLYSLFFVAFFWLVSDGADL